MSADLKHAVTETAITELTPQEFVQLADPPFLIDVRSDLEYRMGHAPGAVNLSMPRILMGMGLGLQRWFLPSWFRQLSSDTPIALICLTSHRSPIVAQRLAKAGFSQVFNISGGMMAWNQANLPIKTGKSETPEQEIVSSAPEVKT
jgi:rhodanese-related sulfurtransferase